MAEAEFYKWARQALRPFEGRCEAHLYQQAADLVVSALMNAYKLGVENKLEMPCNALDKEETGQMKVSDIPMECSECGWKGKCENCELNIADGWFACPKCFGAVEEIEMMMPKTQRDEFIDLENAKTELLEALEPFVEAGEGVEWETTKDHHTFYPVNSMGGMPISMGDLRRAMEIHKKYGGSNE